MQSMVRPLVTETNDDGSRPRATPAQDPYAVDPDGLCVVLYPPDEGFWLKITWLLGFVASFVLDGVCLSLTLLDARVGMTGSVPPRTRTLEHVATVLLFRHLIEPLSCACINHYGFRYCLFIGSLLSIMWITLLLHSTGNIFIFEYCLVSAIIGGIGMGAIKTSFSVLLSSLFLVNRQNAHLSRHLGSFSGMMLIPPFTEYVLLMSYDWRSALHFHLTLICSSLVFWLFVVTPVPLKIQPVDEEQSTEDVSQFQSRAVSTEIQNTENFSVSSQFPTIRKTIGRRGGKTCMRNLMNMFENRTLGSRPMYRDDILFNGDVRSLVLGLKSNKYFEFLMSTTRVFTKEDLIEEKCGRHNISCPIAIRRVLQSMYDTSIWCNEKFVLLLISEALIYASRFLPFVFIKGPEGLKTSAEAMIILIAGCLGSLIGRSIGYLFHETSSNGVVPLYHVSLVLIANGLSLFLCTTGSFVTMLPYFGLFGFVFGYYASLKNAVIYSMFPLQKLNNVRGYISVVRALSSFFGILIALVIFQRNLLPPVDNENVYIFAGMLMTIGGVSVGLLRQDMAAAVVVRSLDHSRVGPCHVVQIV
ncbi:uncharacterized protein LOC112689960 [Sipha flava]|uniref:Uncharacterized protein LOC112689960 n=3 Tax=Sipha flava TaxID=143950 RepID=A0A8B8G9S2_9HEMI|nr:uncharacterized protein LOC112689960 [Sipha flava]